MARFSSMLLAAVLLVVAQLGAAEEGTIARLDPSRVADINLRAIPLVIHQVLITCRASQPLPTRS